MELIIFGIIFITPFAVITFSYLGVELLKSGMLDKLYYNKNVRRKELETDKEIEKIVGEEYNLKREKNIIFPDGINKTASRNGKPNTNKRMFISETPEIKLYNVSNKEENRRSQHGKFYQEEEIQNDFEEKLSYEEDDPIKEYSMFDKIKKYLRRN